MKRDETREAGAAERFVETENFESIALERRGLFERSEFRSRQRR